MKHQILLTVLFLLPAFSLAAADTSGRLPAVEEIVSQMGAHDLQRQELASGYSGMRLYILENGHLHKHAEMLVKVQGERDGSKHFEVVSEQGWNAANKHVLHKMVESEAETSLPEARNKTRLNLENYNFEVLGTELITDRMSYVLEVTPKRKDKYLFQGRIWVDVEDYALVRAEGNPAKSPSFWIKNTHFVQTYGKSGFLWFPVSTQSVTEARIFGTTDVSVRYFDYTPKVTQPSDNFSASVKGTP